MKVLARFLMVGLLLTLAACSPQPGAPIAAPSPTSPPYNEEEAQLAGLTPDEALALASIQKVDDHPLYTLHLKGDIRAAQTVIAVDAALPAWGCSLFAALGNPEERIYGRNFDWEHSPALLLFSQPEEGYASVSMVDIAYLGYRPEREKAIHALPLSDRAALLGAPRLPFDGMNARGLAVGMAAVPPGNMKPKSGKEAVGSLGVMRHVLDRAGTVDEALNIFDSYNIDFAGGPPIHYLVADASGQALLVEFYQGEMRTFRNEQPYHLATNFLVAEAGGQIAGQCPRYDTIEARMKALNGRLDAGEALSLLKSVAQDNTQWSVVYNLSRKTVDVIMGRHYETVHSFQLEP